MQRYSRAQKALGLLIAFAVMLACLLVYAIVSSPARVATPLASASLDTTAREPDLSYLIPFLFNYQDDFIEYDWVTAVTADGKEQLVEMSSFTHAGQPYEFVLSTFKASPNDAEYTIPDYLMLTMYVENEQGGIDEVAYTDLEADGELDSVYLNDVMMPLEALATAEMQYKTELLILQDYLLSL